MNLKNCLNSFIHVLPLSCVIYLFVYLCSQLDELCQNNECEFFVRAIIHLYLFKIGCWKTILFLSSYFFLDFSCSFPLLYLHVRSRCLLQFSFVVLWKKCIHTWPLPLFCSLCRSCFFVCICLCIYVCVRTYMFICVYEFLRLNSFSWYPKPTRVLNSCTLYLRQCSTCLFSWHHPITWGWFSRSYVYKIYLQMHLATL